MKHSSTMKQQLQKEISLLKSLSRHEARKLGCGAIAGGCFLLLVFFLAVFSAFFGPVHDYELKLNIGTDLFLAKIESPLVQESTMKPLSESLEMENKTRKSNQPEESREAKNVTVIERKDHLQSENLNSLETKTSPNMTRTEMKEETISVCDLSQRRSDFCYIEGDIRVDRDSSTIYFVNPHAEIPSDGFWKIRPYARKTDQRAMSSVTELKVKPLMNSRDLPSCSVTHSVPVIVFSTAGYNGNLFHDFSDVIIPLFLTSHHYNEEVQFMITNGKTWWRNKYGKLLRQLSHYEIIDFDNDHRVHCFTKLRVGLTEHKEFSIDPKIKSFNGYSSMQEFRNLMMDSYSLSRRTVTQIRDGEKRKPRLLILSRNRTRKLRNVQETIKLSKKLGFEVVVADDGMTRDLSRFARIVNSCDVMMGVHGAGFTNMVFLPAGAVIIQIVPYGRLDWISTVFFARPAKDMKLKYLEYDISMEESSLIEQYPSDDPVLKDPISVHRKGWNVAAGIYLFRQDVKLNLNRFKGVLVDAKKLLHQKI
ncbi:alpha-1,3-arabinosyltransferase XAT3-like [Nymphaea colorata]|nr:alpha-1,3-arabinosyltransferase XAT3-like [Nymphaea colorata]